MGQETNRARDGRPPASGPLRERNRISLNRMVFRLTAPVIMVVLASTAVGCRRPQRTGEGDGGSAGDPPVGENSAGATRARPGPDGPKLGATALQVNVYGRPDGTSKRLGYLRLGTEGRRHHRCQPPAPAGGAAAPRHDQSAPLPLRFRSRRRASLLARAHRERAVRGGVQVG